MKNLIQISIQVMMILVLTSGFSQIAHEKESLYDLMQNAFNRHSSILWDKSITQAKTLYETTNKPEDLLNLCWAHYGAMASALSNRDKKLGEAIYKVGLQYIKQLHNHEAYQSRAEALLGGLHGMAIGLSPMKGMYLGPKSDKHIGKALELNPKNAFAWLQKGSSQYHTPKMFGGNISHSIESFEKSIAYFDRDSAYPSFLQIEAMIWLGQALTHEKKYAQAKEVYENILRLEPNVIWVSEILLPELNSQIKLP